MQTQAQRYITPEEYFAIERRAEYKSEYFNGEVFAMAAGSPRHNRIAANVIALLQSQLFGRSCQVYTSDQQIKIPATGLYTYPDAVVVCGELQLDDIHPETIVNPTLLIEVL